MHPGLCLLATSLFPFQLYPSHLWRCDLVDRLSVAVYFFATLLSIFSHRRALCSLRTVTVYSHWCYAFVVCIAFRAYVTPHGHHRFCDEMKPGSVHFLLS